MPGLNSNQSSRQNLFMSMVLGVLLYSVVLGFFNDYTDILSTKSYSVTFAVAIVMQLLTYLTLLLKDRVVLRFKSQAESNKFGLIFSVWLIMFVSKFVFLAVIEFIFQGEVVISGFIGLLIVIICLTVAQSLVEHTYRKLAD